MTTALSPANRHAIRAERRRDDEFSRVVNLDLREQLDRRRADWLRSRPIIMDWVRELQASRESIRFQIGERRRLLTASPYHPRNQGKDNGRPLPEFLNQKQEYEEWYARVLRLERAIAERLAEAKTLLANYGMTMDAAEWTLILVTLAELLEQGDADSAKRLVEKALRVAHNDGLER